MAKRRYVDEDNSVLQLIYHDEAKHLSCVCGEILNGRRHVCPVSIKEKSSLEISPCSRKCKTCSVWSDNQRKLEIYHNQWAVLNDNDIDIIYCCTSCDIRCERELPK